MAEIERGKPRPENDVYRILVLNHQADRIEEITIACKELGQEVVPKMTIKDAIYFLDTKDHVDVVVAEAFLEDESSLDFLRQLKNLPHHKDVPVVLVAMAPGEVARFCSDTVALTANFLGAHKFLIMPDYSVSQLMKEVQAILPERKIPKKDLDPDGAY